MDALVEMRMCVRLVVVSVAMLMMMMLLFCSHVLM
jgi:hypothetical protein